MKFIKDLSIRNKLLLIALIPLLALLYFLGISVRDKVREKNVLEQVRQEVLRGEAFSDLIHQLQQERGVSQVYMLAGGTGGQTELFTQRERTDQAFLAVSQLETGPAVARVKKGLSALRDEVDSRNIPVGTMQERLAVLVFDLLNQVNQTVLYSRNPEVKELLNAHLFLMYGKEYFGELRAKLSEILLSKGTSRVALSEFASLKGRYEQNLERFRQNTSPALKELAEHELNDAANVKVRNTIETIYRSEAAVLPLTYEEWWTSGVSFLNSLKRMEDQSTLAIRNMAEGQLKAISAEMVRSVVIGVVLLLLIGLLLYVIIRSLASSVLHLKQIADRVAVGDLDISVGIDSKDEIGSLAASFNQLIQETRLYARGAELIGSGDYSPEIRVRSQADTLGLSLNNMKDNLKRLSEENEKRTWLLTGNGELNDRIRGEKELRELARDIISQLTAYLGAQIGAIYLLESGRLVLSGTYAFHHRKQNNNIIELGQGLVGQAALEKKPILFSGVPEDYVRINSGIGNSVPRNLIVFPFEHEGQLKGVMEIGSVNEFTDLQLEFLGLVSNNIGIAFHSSQSRTLLKELLEETQRQTEELEAQHEELRQMNEELQEKTDLLEKSEAELKAQQEELQQTNEELEEKASLLEEQKEALEIAKLEVETKARELEVTSRYKSEFLANMSHELRTPLNSILILAQLLAENKSKSLPEKEVGFAQNIYSSGTDLLNLINEILDLSKVESGKIELEIGPVSLANVTSNLESLFQELARTKAMEFRRQIAESALKQPLVTDQQRLEQILRNLLSNAFKFTGKGGTVTLDIAEVPTAQVGLNPKLRSLETVLAFSVKDTGIGIPKEKQALIFEAFQQADGSTKRKYGGTGLGLSISRELARALGGEIQLASEEGKGSTFTLYLPATFDASFIDPVEKEVLVREPAQAVRETRSPAPVHTGEPVDDDRYAIGENQKVILIIEDDVQFARILLNFVREKGYKGIMAHQGNAGLSLARYYHPDAIILDMQLPVMDGSQVLKHLKNDPDLRHIPVQVISGYDRKKEGFELGAFDFVKKPVNQAELNSAFGRIEEFINRKLKKLLVVEDNPSQNLAIRELIGNGDVKSFPAYTGEEAYQMLVNDNFDCIIIDLGLPDMGGIDLMEKLKADERLRKVPVIVYTGQDLSREETARLNKLASTVVLKTADSK
ncbi:MAG TPA: response regulator, partial [Sphingobacteriaceae bacterium]